MRCLAERSIQHQQDFIDYEKAFDKVKHSEIMKDLEHFGVDGKDLQILKNLYWSQYLLMVISVTGHRSREA